MVTVLSLVSCSTPSEKSELSTSAVASESVSPSATPSKTKVSDPSVAPGKLISTKFGEYRQITIPKDASYLKAAFDSADPSFKEIYSEDELKDGIYAAFNYTATHTFDSPINGGAVTYDEWWKTAQFDYVEDYRDAARATLGGVDENGNLQSMVIDNQVKPELRDKYMNVKHIYNGEDTRIRNLEIQSFSVFRLENPELKDIALTVGFSFNMPVTYTKDGKEEIGYQTVSGTNDISVRKDETGEWKVSGWGLTYSAPLTETPLI